MRFPPLARLLVLSLALASCSRDGTPPTALAAAIASPTIRAAASSTVPPAPATPPDSISSDETLVIHDDWIPLPDERLQQMDAYSLRHYGEASHRLEPRAIVLHFTATRTYRAARDVFVHNHAHRGELPGVCAHFMVDKDGSVYALVPPDVRCRHAIGLNDSALGIEIVQEASGTDRWADAQILARRAQLEATLRLVRALQHRYGIPDARVLGHAMANESALFHDLEGWRNDHGDWAAPDVARFVRMLAP